MNIWNEALFVGGGQVSGNGKIGRITHNSGAIVSWIENNILFVQIHLKPAIWEVFFHMIPHCPDDPLSPGKGMEGQSAAAKALQSTVEISTCWKTCKPYDGCDQHSQGLTLPPSPAPNWNETRARRWSWQKDTSLAVPYSPLLRGDHVCPQPQYHPCRPDIKKVKQTSGKCYYANTRGSAWCSVMTQRGWNGEVGGSSRRRRRMYT